jgi:hypothetical protein
MEALSRRQHTVSEAWEIISRPVEDELIKIPEHRPWHLPGLDRRFLRGLVLGLGTGLVIAALTPGWLSERSTAPLGTIQRQDSGKAPGTGQASDSGASTGGKPVNQPGQPAATQPGQPGTPSPKPADVTIVVEVGDAAATIGERLKAAGLITDVEAFVNRVTERGLEGSLKAGTFVVPTGATLDQVIDTLTQ